MSNPKTKLFIYVTISACVIFAVWLGTVKYLIKHELNGTKKDSLFGDIKLSLSQAWAELPDLSAPTTTDLQGGAKLNKEQFDDLIDKLDIMVSTSTPTTTDLKVETQINTSDWLTYQNEKYGYEIKYPKESRYPINTRSDTNVKDGLTRLIGNTYATKAEYADSIVLGWGYETGLEIYFFEKIPGISLAEYVDSLVDTNNSNNTLSTEEINNRLKKGKFAGRDTLEFIIDDECCLCDKHLDGVRCKSSSDKKTKFVYFNYDNQITGKISYQMKSYFEDYSEYHAKLFEAMLSTFKFTQ